MPCDSAMERAVTFLLARRDADHLWRDYDLPPGPSWAWTTAWTGWALASLRPNALGETADALCAIRTDGGWSYNPAIAPDADSTAWALRCLAAFGDPRAAAFSGLLLPFITDEGGVRTFLRPYRYGAWAQGHADVTPTAGLALIECGGNAATIARLRRWTLNQRTTSGHWASFWWSTDAYATAWTLTFLAASGGIPEDVRATCSTWAARRPPAGSAMAAALHVLAALALDRVDAGDWARHLLMCQQPDGGWPPSATLLVPAQRGGAAPAVAHADGRAIMTTAIAAYALHRWRGASPSHSPA